MWSRILGHQPLIDSFQGLVRRGRLAHAYLFVGRPGIGKSLFAHELAKALLCDSSNPEKLEACDHCVSCTLVDAFTHPDYFVVRRPEDTQELKIDPMRELCRNFGLKPARGRGKVAVLEDADDLNEEAANCFLKTLEEPPPRSVFILIGTSPDRQLPTILSRSHIVRFPSLHRDLVDQILQKNEIAAAQRPRLVQAARGSPGQALALADEALWEARRKLLDGFSQSRVHVLALARSFLEMVEEAGKESAAQRQRALLILGLLVAAWTEALHLTLGDANVRADATELAYLQTIARRVSPEQLMDLIERCLAAERQIGLYIQVALVLEGLVEACARILEENPTTALISSTK